MNSDLYDNDDNIDMQGKNKRKSKHQKNAINNNNNTTNNELALLPSNPLMNYVDTKTTNSLPM